MQFSVNMEGSTEWKKLVQKVADEFGSTGVEVGVIEYNGDDEHYPAEGDEPTHLPIAEIARYAYWNEFGTVRTPMRPFMRNTIAEKSSTWSKVFTAYAQGKILVDGAAVDAWKGLGDAAKNDILETIHRGVPPENAPSTIIRKMKPATATRNGKTETVGIVMKGTLIDEGNLIKSITFQVLRK